MFERCLYGQYKPWASRDNTHDLAWSSDQSKCRNWGSVFVFATFGRQLPTCPTQSNASSTFPLAPTNTQQPLAIVHHLAVTMGIWEAFSEIVDAVAPWSVVEAEAPAEETQVSKIDDPTPFFAGCKPHRW